MIRSLTESDLPAILDLCAKGHPHEPHAWTEALAREKTLGARDFEPDLLLGFEAAGRVRGFVQAVAREWGGEQRGWVRLLAVNPAWWGQGIGTALLTEAESRLKSRGADHTGVMDACPNYLTPGVDFRHTAAVCFLEKSGYSITGTSRNMMCDLTADDFADCDAGITEALRRGLDVRRAEPADRESLTSWARREFPDWEEEILACFDWDPISLWIALRGGEVLGFAAHDANNVNTGHFGPTGVAPAARGEGVGALLTRLALRDQRRQGHRRAVIPWVGPIRFYAKCCGAWIDRVFWRFEKRL